MRTGSTENPLPQALARLQELGQQASHAGQNLFAGTAFCLLCLWSVARGRHLGDDPWWSVVPSRGRILWCLLGAKDSVWSRPFQFLSRHHPNFVLTTGIL